MGNRSRKRRGRAIDGLLLLDKPGGVTSNQALQECKRLMYAAKAGHTGSLDPLATGLLPLCFGEATKFSQYLLNAQKGYFAVIELGATSDTQDADGQITVEADPSTLTDAAIEEALLSLHGEQQQIPPMYSALKHNGQRLYDLARDGIEVERDARDIVVHSVEFVRVIRSSNPTRVALECNLAVSKGTYIRSLAEVLGEKLGVGGYLSQLRRTEVGGFHVEQAVTIDTLRQHKESEEFAKMDKLLVPVERALDHLPEVQLDETTGYYLSKGNPVQTPDAPLEGEVRVSMEGGKFLGIGFIDDEGRVAPRRLVADL